MKRFFFSSISIFFGFMMVVVSAVATGQEQSGGSPQVTTIQTNNLSDEQESSVSAQTMVEPTLTIAEKVDVNYYLAYPGILPDHPLYFLKMIRDRTRLWIANTPEKKIQLMRLYADKRLGAGKALIEGGKVDLGIDTIVKSHGYVLRMLGEAKRTSNSYDYSEIKTQLEFHIQIVEQLIQRLEGQDLSRLNQVLEESEESYRFVLTTFEEPSETVNNDAVPQAPIDENLRPAEFGR